MEFKGSNTALVTPIRDGRFDEAAFRAFVEWQIAILAMMMTKDQYFFIESRIRNARSRKLDAVAGGRGARISEAACGFREVFPDRPSVG